MNFRAKWQDVRHLPVCGAVCQHKTYIIGASCVDCVNHLVFLQSFLCTCLTKQHLIHILLRYQIVLFVSSTIATSSFRLPVVGLGTKHETVNHGLGNMTTRTQITTKLFKKMHDNYDVDDKLPSFTNYQIFPSNCHNDQNATWNCCNVNKWKPWKPTTNKIQTTIKNRFNNKFKFAQIPFPDATFMDSCVTWNRPRKQK